MRWSLVILAFILAILYSFIVLKEIKGLRDDLAKFTKVIIRADGILNQEYKECK